MLFRSVRDIVPYQVKVVFLYIIFLKTAFVKSQGRISNRPAPPGRFEWVVSIYSAVPLSFQGVSHGRRCVFYVFIVRNAPIREEIHGISRQELKFGVCGICALDRHIELSFYCVFSKAVKERKVIFRQLNGAVVVQISKGLIHNSNNVRRLLARGSCFGRIIRRVSFCNLFNLFDRVVLLLFDSNG